MRCLRPRELAVREPPRANRWRRCSCACLARCLCCFLFNRSITRAASSSRPRSGVASRVWFDVLRIRILVARRVPPSAFHAACLMRRRSCLATSSSLKSPTRAMHVAAGIRVHTTAPPPPVPNAAASRLRATGRCDPHPVSRPSSRSKLTSPVRTASLSRMKLFGLIASFSNERFDPSKARTSASSCGNDDEERGASLSASPPASWRALTLGNSQGPRAANASDASSPLGGRATAPFEPCKAPGTASTSHALPSAPAPMPTYDSIACCTVRSGSFGTRNSSVSTNASQLPVAMSPAAARSRQSLSAAVWQ